MVYFICLLQISLTKITLVYAHEHPFVLCSRTSFRLSSCSGKYQHRMSEVRSVRKRLRADMYSQYVPKQSGLIRDLLHFGNIVNWQ